MPRFCATAAMPAVRQLASPTSTYSIGVIAWSSDAKISGWSASNELSVLCCCSCPRPKKPWILALPCVPLIHWHLARQLKAVPPGAPFNAWRASTSAGPFPPWLTLVVAISVLPDVIERGSHESYIGGEQGVRTFPPPLYRRGRASGI